MSAWWRGFTCPYHSPHLLFLLHGFLHSPLYFLPFFLLFIALLIFNFYCLSLFFTIFSLLHLLSLPVQFTTPAGFEVLKPVVMKSSIFWDITPFRRSMSHLSRCWKNNPCKKPARSSACYLLSVGFLHVLWFHLEDGCDMFLWNVGCLSDDFKALYLRI
jgi:hypothetical protein